MSERSDAVPDVPEAVRAKALVHGAERWLTDLPDLLADISAEWELTIGATFGDGTEALVVEATMRDGRRAVLKLMVPRAGHAARDEIEVLQRVNGEGCPALYRHDLDREAMLVERLGPSLHELGLPIDQRLEILCTTAQRLWRSAADAGLSTGADKGRWLIENAVRRWEALDGPCTERALDYAVRCAERRIEAHDDDTAVLVHGDVHEWNVLRSLDGATDFKLIDPDGLLADPEYDLGIILREDPVELLADIRRGAVRARAIRLAHRTGTDPQKSWEWGAIERVSTGLIGMEIGMEPVSSAMLAAADAISEVERSG